MTHFADQCLKAESLFEESLALNLLGSHLLDSEIGQDFFSDPWRMHRDLLGPAAANYLDQLVIPDRTTSDVQR